MGSPTPRAAPGSPPSLARGEGSKAAKWHLSPSYQNPTNCRPIGPSPAILPVDRTQIPSIGACANRRSSSSIASPSHLLSNSQVNRDCLMSLRAENPRRLLLSSSSSKQSCAIRCMPASHPCSLLSPKTANLRRPAFCSCARSPEDASIVTSDAEICIVSDTEPAEEIGRASCRERVS